jgi:hypothetical protein
MAKVIKEVSTFPSGTSENEVRAIQGLRLSSAIVRSCEIDGNDGSGWTMTTIWEFPG